MSHLYLLEIPKNRLPILFAVILTGLLLSGCGNARLGYKSIDPILAQASGAETDSAQNGSDTSGDGSGSGGDIGEGSGGSDGTGEGGSGAGGTDGGGAGGGTTDSTTDDGGSGAGGSGGSGGGGGGSGGGSGGSGGGGTTGGGTDGGGSGGGETDGGGSGSGTGDTTGGDTTGGTGGTSDGDTTNGDTTGGTGGTTADGDTTGSSAGGDGGSSDGSTSGGTTGNQWCVVEHHTQPAKESIRKVDLLFVTDTSGSIKKERAQIAQGISNFIQQFPAKTDLQISVMLAHGSTSTHSGNLYRANQEPTVLKKSSSYPLSVLKIDLNTKLTQVVADLDSDGGESGLYSLSRALEPNRLEEIRQTHGFFRSDAALAVVFVSDENDICAIFPEGVQRVRDPEGKEGPSFTRDCKNQPFAQNVYTRLKEIQKSNPLVVSGIIYTDRYPTPRQGENEIGYGYTDIIQLANGISIDIGHEDIPKGLAQIGQLTVEKTHLQYDFSLTYWGVDVTAPMSVRVDQFTLLPDLDFSYDSITNKVHLNYAGQALSRIELRYCLHPGIVPQ